MTAFIGSIILKINSRSIQKSGTRTKEKAWSHYRRVRIGGFFLGLCWRLNWMLMCLMILMIAITAIRNGSMWGGIGHKWKETTRCENKLPSINYERATKGARIHRWWSMKSFISAHCCDWISDFASCLWRTRARPSLRSGGENGPVLVETGADEQTICSEIQTGRLKDERVRTRAWLGQSVKISRAKTEDEQLGRSIDRNGLDVRNSFFFCFIELVETGKLISPVNSFLMRLL